MLVYEAEFSDPDLWPQLSDSGLEGKGGETESDSEIQTQRKSTLHT